MIRRSSYQEATEDSRWEYEPVSDFWTNIDPYSDYIVDESSDKGKKDQENFDYQEQ